MTERDKTIVELRTNDRDPDQVHDAAEDLLKFFGLFAERSREYGDHAFVLGSAGQYADMSRKFGKIKTAMWDKKPEQLTSETIEEVLMDMIGHCLLSIQCLRREGVLGHDKMLYRGQLDGPEDGESHTMQEPDASDGEWNNVYLSRVDVSNLYCGPEEGQNGRDLLNKLDETLEANAKLLETNTKLREDMNSLDTKYKEMRKKFRRAMKFLKEEGN